MKNLLMVFISLVLTPSLLLGQENNPLSRVVTAYERGYYQEVVANVMATMGDTTGLNQSDLLYLRTYLAFSLVALDREDEAVSVFKQMLLIKPKMELNPEFVSPKIINVFKKALLEYAQSAGQTGIQSAMVFEKGKPGKMPCLWRSALWPGWGQSYRGEMKKGRIMKWASAGIAAGLVGLFIGTSVSHQSYLDSTDPTVIESRYNNYNRWYRARNFGLNVAISFWIYSAVDILITE